MTERFFYVAARKGGPDLGRALVDRGAILINVSEFAAAAQDLEKSFELLPAHESRCGSRYYLSAVFNLARCRLELASSAAELRHAMELTHEAALLVEPGSQPEIRLRWLAGKLAGRLGLRGKSLMVLSGVHAELCEHGDPMDRALITLDLAELHLERGDPESARQVVLASFGILSPLRENPDAFRAVKLLYTAALETGLDLPTVRSVRSALMAAR